MATDTAQQAAAEAADLLREHTDHPAIAAVVATLGLIEDESDPLDKSGLDVVPRMRDAVADLGPGVTALVGGTSAINYDIDNANQRDLELIVPLALIVMAVILAILLQALVAPLVLLASVVLSFACTLGISILIIRFVVGDAGFDSSIPILQAATRTTTGHAQFAASSVVTR